MDKPQLLRIDRRATLKWAAAAIAAAAGGCAADDDQIVGRDETGRHDAWAARHLGAPKRVTGPGYGSDPDMVNPVVPWELTMSEGQRRIAACVCDVILPADQTSPAASEVGVHEFLDEWVSAPYPGQYADRLLLFEGLGWLELESRERWQVGFSEAGDERQAELVAIIADAAPVEGLQSARLFFERMRYLAMGAFYTTDEGVADLGYIGNTPIAGDYPGPSAEALRHLNQALARLSLPRAG